MTSQANLLKQTSKKKDNIVYHNEKKRTFAPKNKTK